ncbi:MAG: glycosyltransferase family 4 protein [Anaerolineae bacterium]|nr:glycosyltransferase family 4 protein [Anaerolineae bacterium]
MRIWMPLRITLAHGIRGGMERQSDTLARGLVDLGHAVTVVTTAHPGGERVEMVDGVEILYVPGSTWRRYQSSWWRNSYRLLAHRHIYTPYDLILSQSAGGLGYLAQARRDLALPSVVIFHGSSRGEIITAWRGARSPRGIYRLMRLGWRLPRLLTLWRGTAPSVAHWIAPSASVGDENRREIGFPAERLTIIPNGVDIDTFRPDPARRSAARARLGLPEAAPVVVAATRLEAEKGVQVALAALAQTRAAAPDARLVVAGDGGYAESLRRRAADLGLGGAVSFLGFVPHAELPDILAAGDVFVMPSLCHEAFPVSILEALAAGLPVVASRVGGVPAAITPGATGYLVTPGDASALAAALLSLLAAPGRRRAMGALGRRTAEARYSRAATTQAVEDVVRAVVARDVAGQATPRQSSAGVGVW